MTIYDSQFVIYRITNLTNNKVYIGKTQQTSTIRWRDHVYDAQHGSNFLLHRAIRKYGPSSFQFEIICNALSLEDLADLEKLFIMEYDCCIHDGKNKGYNMTRGGEGFDSESSRKTQLRRVEEGTHPLAGAAGSKLQKERYAAGLHNWATPEARQRNIDRLNSSDNPLRGEKGSQMTKHLHAERLAAGTHCTQRVHTCTHCGKTGKGSNMIRYHFDNCKIKHI